MSVRNIIDGSYIVDAPIEMEKLQVSVLIDTTTTYIPLTFERIGNICTLNIGDFSVGPGLYSIVLNLPNETSSFKTILPFKRDFFLTVNGTKKPVVIDWYYMTNQIVIDLLVVSSASSVSSQYSETIIYNIE